MLRIEALNAWWGGAQVLFDVSLVVGQGELVVLQGLNGAGKSSLLQAIMGLGPRTSGEIYYTPAAPPPSQASAAAPASLASQSPRSMAHWPPYQRARAGLGYVAEDRRLFGELSVYENLWIAAQPRSQSRHSLPSSGLAGSTPAQRYERVLALFPALQPLLRRPAAHMSGGEQQMLALARTLMTGPQLLLLDEPCEGIAPVLVRTLSDALLQLAREGVTMLVAEQNHLLASHAQRVLTLVGGRLADQAQVLAG